MGSGSFSTSTYNYVSKDRDYTKKSADAIFSKSLKDSMNPAKFKDGMRECRDSDDHPYSVPIMVFLDVTGSMGSIPEKLIKDKFPDLMETLIKNNVEDAQVCFGAIGDHISDKVPLQCGQFEQDTVKLLDSLQDVFIEKGGGGQYMESYPLAWYTAAYHTSTDSFEKRGLKGFLFTIGDENFHKKYDGKTICNIMGIGEAEEKTAQQLYDAACEKYHVFHIHVNDGSYTMKQLGTGWEDLLKERLLILKHSDNVAELIATTVAVINGADMDKVLSSIDKDAATNVSTALVNFKDILPTVVGNKNQGVIKLD
jgi:hypothetical protein